MKVAIRLEPLGVTVQVEAGTSLADALALYGVEFPCGGAGICEGCRVQVAGRDPQLACRMTATEPLTLQVEQWHTPVLTDSTPLQAGKRRGRGIAVDLGSTTVVAQLVDLSDGRVLDLRTAVNAQAVFGADVMTRIQLALHDPALTTVVREQIAAMTADTDIEEVVMVGNTAMHHLYLGLPVESLAAAPFRTPHGGEHRDGRTRFLRCLGGFVGSDILAGIAATQLHRLTGLSALIDLGTNGEIVVARDGRLICASTAAGPAFGMRASTGAIAHVAPGPVCRTIGGAKARGLCGSGLVDAVAVGLADGHIAPNGRLRQPYTLTPEVALTQRAVRELQLAKAALAAGLRMLLRRCNAEPADLDALYLAGAFGNHLDVRNAMRIGLLPDIDPARIHPSGNAALRGARTILLDPEAEPRVEVEHVELAADGAFQDEFAAALPFPDGVLHEQQTTTAHLA
jgi:uncharacterized 2Fe-2S/4Fe-4S cluster protein (DUF4445 family)